MKSLRASSLVSTEVEVPAAAAAGRTAQPAGGAAADTPRVVITGGKNTSDGTLEYGERYELRRRVSLKGVDHGSIVSIPLPKPGGNPRAALTDWLNITFPFQGTSEAVRALLEQLSVHLGNGLGGLTDRGRGLHGYYQSFAFDQGGALFAFGGQRGTGFLSLPGEACAVIPDWGKAVTLFRDVLGARITRWDGAVDDLEGRHGVDDAVAWYKAGLFNAGGNKPSCTQAGNWIEADGKGRTFYVGSRRSGKLTRIYEKGKQLGAADSPWVRWELELHNVDREIPFEVLLEPGKYVAGSYPCMAWVQEEVSRIRTINETYELSYEHLVDCLRQSYGRLVNAMMEQEGSAEKVVERIRRAGVPDRFQLPRVPDGQDGES